MENWREIKEYEGLYEVSDLGNVRSLSRIVKNNGGTFVLKERIIKPTINSSGYLKCNLCKNGICTNKNIAILVAVAFLNHIPNGHNFIIDHINGIRTDNRLENLRIVTHRENGSVCFRKLKNNFTSEFVGVSWQKSSQKWIASISINGKSVYLGLFNNELEASKAYQEKLQLISEN